MDLSCATIACVAILARRTALAIHVRSQFVYVHIYGLHSQELYTRLVHSWNKKRIYSYSRVFPIGGEWDAYSPAVFGRFGRFWYSAVSGVLAVFGGHVTHL